MKPYVIGIDYGTLSGRCVLLDSRDGREVAESVLEYRHGVMDRELPCGRKLPAEYALQHPEDYLEVLRVTVPEVLRKGGVTKDEVSGLGIDFTACTMLPINEDGTPLCMLSKFENEPHAYVKLWKHHGAQREADEINALAEKRGEKWLSAYGGKISSEWMFPKILETLHKAPEVYESTYRFIEAADWLSLMLTGRETHSAAFAGYKALWSSEDGYPSNEFWQELDPRLDGIVGTKVSTNIFGADKTAGKISPSGAELCSLSEGTAVSIPQIDAHAAMPSLGIIRDGELMMIIGTSSCHILNSRVGETVKGICGYVRDAVIPGYYTYEAGQSGVGDIFDWFTRSCVPASYTEEAKERGIGIHKLLRKKASKLEIGESGLVALDWHSGNRSILMDSSLSGMILGLTLNTRPEEIYRAYIEATAFGAKMILDTFSEGGVKINNIYAAGGIAQKDELMMQIYADVLDRDIHIAASSQAGARGSAIYASVAAGLFPTLESAVQGLSVGTSRTYSPIKENVEAYKKLYDEYLTLYRYFGMGGNDVMRRMKEITTNDIMQ